VNRSPDPLLLEQAHQAGPLGRLALSIAAGELGAEEVPKGSNRGPRIEVYQRGYAGLEYLVGQRWCARFARWCIETAAQQLKVPSPFATWKSDLASALKWRDQARLRRCWTPDPAPGRVGLHLSDSGAGHVVLVAKVGGDLVASIGGNEGNAVRVVRRPRSYFTAGYVEVG